MGLPWWVERDLWASFRKSVRGFWEIAFIPGRGAYLGMWRRFGPSVNVFRLYEGTPPRLVRQWDVPTAALRTMEVNEVAKQALSALAKVAAAREVAKAAGPPVSKSDKDKYPNLVDFMTLTVDPTGKRRTPSKVQLTYDLADGGWRTMVVDELNESILFTHAETLDAVLEATEQHLGSDAPDWREDRFAAQRKAKKGK